MQNSLEAILEAAGKGFGIETDIRDQCGQLVISHDPPTGDALALEKLLDALDGKNTELLLNVKADGLQHLAESALSDKNLDVKFFDMSIPEVIKYSKSGLPYLSRVSELESIHGFDNRCKGLWIDDFSGFWLDAPRLDEISSLGVELYFVSAELHGNNRMDQWNLLKRHLGQANYRLCTDFPFEAEEFFND
jgi:hypothetical protein